MPMKVNLYRRLHRQQRLDTHAITTTTKASRCPTEYLESGDVSLPNFIRLSIRKRALEFVPVV